MQNAFAIKKLKQAGYGEPMRKGKAKKGRIRKYEDTYYIPIAYVGLMEMNSQGSRSSGYGGGNAYQKTKYVGQQSKDSALGRIEVRASIEIETAIRNSEEWYDYDDYQMPEDYGMSEETWRENRKLRGENMRDMTSVEMEWLLTYSLPDAPNGDTSIFRAKGGCYSIEDAIDAIAQKSEEAWGEVTIWLSDKESEFGEFEDMAQYYPDKLNLDIPADLTISDNSTAFEGKVYRLDRDSDIAMNVEWVVKPVTDEEGGYYDRNASHSQIRDRSIVPKGYDVYVKGRLTDYNEQTSWNISSGGEPGNWVRDFGYQGAQTIAEVEQIISQNIQEVYEEFQAYIQSDRKYETVGHGTGHRRTTENTDPWNYNFGDNYEDIRYEEFMEQSVAHQIKNEIEDKVGRSRYGIGVRDNKDGTFTLRIETMSYADNEIESVLQTLDVLGYEVLSSERTNYGVDVIVLPRVFKSKALRKSVIRAMQNAIRKSRAKN